VARRDRGRGFSQMIRSTRLSKQHQTFSRRSKLAMGFVQPKAGRVARRDRGRGFSQMIRSTRFSNNIQTVHEDLSWRWDSNPRPTDYKSVALPAELRQHIHSSKTLELQLALSNSPLLVEPCSLIQFPPSAEGAELRQHIRISKNSRALKAYQHVPGHVI
jgi:hypothetical protein